MSLAPRRNEMTLTIVVLTIYAILLVVTLKWWRDEN